MAYELWRELEEEVEGDSQARRPEIGHIFFVDRGGVLSWRGTSPALGISSRARGTALPHGWGGAGFWGWGRGQLLGGNRA